MQELKSCTDGVFVKIIDDCYQHDLPLPEVGYELMNEAGEVTDHEPELAREEQMVGIYAKDSFDSQDLEVEGWRLFGPDIAQNMEELFKAFG